MTKATHNNRRISQKLERFHWKKAFVETNKKFN